LLCRGCNHAIGGARENPAVLRRLADYLEAHSSEREAPDGITDCAEVETIRAFCLSAAMRRLQLPRGLKFRPPLSSD
jgi:hypothetical protein